ncbi:MAG TPA: hypothetical protein VNK04_23245 [Gemmataceae bacterium]|nr:hypothetical protein [Gemmataceae bacterium]
MEYQPATVGPEILEVLRAEWDALLRPFGAAEGPIREVLAALIRLYAREGRFYHTLRHVQEVLQVVGNLSSLTADPAAVRFAAWFHDAIYDPRAPDNEERSAVLCEQSLARLGVPRPTAAAAAAMIRATQHHQVLAGDRDCQVLLDADLAILGALPPRYAEYAADIRREYAWMPEAEYRVGRSRVLQAFLRRKPIYFTEPMRAALEERARQNLRAELAALARDQGAVQSGPA